MKKQLQKTNQFLNNNKGYIALGATLMLASVDASAFTAPTATTDFLYDAYDVVINKLSKGGVGFAVGAAMTLGAAVAAMKGSYVIAGTTLVAAFIGAKLDTVTTSLGMVTSFL
ncbi:hypothetical protein CRYPA_1738 [uncultured Candidatus Thioglobus sp.]|uniref:hypothetical protein n=1 Tax=Bathymodiolus heckerae thiotrophic gill symbiont TaxID=1052212 RepID=UPI0010B81C46|nr:hypothetical protein [Bathymodiolus heckerae thiotrophic gill symbiont]CAC9588327.1 hypothetical protein [uncultured Gammaproteobacteria bacterium]SMN15725.1 hypothetical protein CRYPA_1738 [uncultured Candidatus Thioglobus sp.]CAC9593428.1 hypothetical protein [uncultured Gammaproteobacteria bacterium]CAC9959239.1 hypothetical protein [uncultured Gammaproteobacteria bacterium]SHN89545.1 hypothetical protein BHECKSOX_2012 [Bathymodiolus heckerae thiotrophic gill symbiont]